MYWLAPRPGRGTFSNRVLNQQQIVAKAPGAVRFGTVWDGFQILTVWMQRTTARVVMRAGLAHVAAPTVGATPGAHATGKNMVVLFARVLVPTQRYGVRQPKPRVAFRKRQTGRSAALRWHRPLATPQTKYVPNAQTVVEKCFP